MNKKLLSITAILAAVISTSVFADNYKIFVDAGSTGSRVHLFQYDADKNIPVIKDVFSESNKSGLSSFEKNPQEAGKSLQKLFDDVSQQLKEKHIELHDVEVNVLATAGMRYLDEKIQKEIYASVTKFVAPYGFKMGHIETISGKMEALYGWLDVNYLAQHFQNNTPTQGAIDMGGASTEIAFETQANSQSDDVVSFALNGRQYAVFAKSFLGLGQDKARDAMTITTGAESCYPAGYQMTPTSKGQFNFANCSPLYAKLIESKKVAEQMMPLTQQSVVAFSGAYYTYNFLAADQTPDQSALENRIMAVCTKSWDQLKEDYRSVAEKYLSSYCANAVYMDALFYSTYHIRPGQLSVATKINQQDIDWTFGAMLFSLIQNESK